MVQEIEKYLNCNEFLRNNIDKYKEAFIKYYGEDKREEIEAAFAKAIFIAFQTPKAVETSIVTLQEEKSKEIIGRALEGCSTFTVEDINYKSSLKNSRFSPLSAYIEFLKKFNLPEEEQTAICAEQGYKAIKRYLPELTKEEFDEMFRTGKISKKYDVLKSWLRENLEYWIDLNHSRKIMIGDFKRAEPLLLKIDNKITIDTFSSYADNPRLQELNRIASIYPSMIEEYEEFMKKYQEKIKELEEGDASQFKIQAKAYKKLIEANLDLIPESKKKGLAEFFEDPNKLHLLDKFIQETFFYSFYSHSALEAFTTESEEILKKGKAVWKIKCIHEDRINFLNSLGLDLGDDYAAYENNEEARSLWPTTERVDEFFKTKLNMQNKANIEYYENLPFYKKIRREINSHHLLDKQDSFNAGLFTNPKTFVDPNVIATSTGYDLFSLLVVKCDDRSGMIDHHVIHELNHLYELHLNKVEDDRYEAICGWDILQRRINQSEVAEANTLVKNKRYRKYTLFNEIINEIISQEISEIFRGDENYIFDTPDNAQDKGTTSYEDTFFLVKDFYSEFKDKILASRHNGNIQIIWDEVGKENFDALNELFGIFNEHFEGAKYYNLLDDMSNNADTPRTRIYKQIIAKRDEILKRMRTHSMQHEATMTEKQPQAEETIQK